MIESFPTADMLIPAGTTFVLISTRLAFLFLTMPVFSSNVLPRNIRGAIVAVLSLAVFFGLPFGAVTITNPTAMIIALLGEAAVGTAAGVAARLVFAAVEAAGELIGVPMGMGFSQLIDPMSQSHSVVTARLLSLIISMIFLAVDAHHVVIKLVTKSFQVLRPGHVVLATGTGTSLAKDASLIFIGAVQLAAPVLLVIMASMFSLGILARAVPRVNLLVLSFAVSIILGLLTLRFAAFDIGGWMIGEVNRIEPLTLRTLDSFGSN